VPPRGHAGHRDGLGDRLPQVGRGRGNDRRGGPSRRRRARRRRAPPRLRALRCVPVAALRVARESMTTDNHLRDRPTGELVRSLSTQVSTLVRQELELAKVELTAKGKQAGIGAGMFGGAGLFALYGVGALIATAILVMDLIVAAWLAALIVAAVLFAVAG